MSRWYRKLFVFTSEFITLILGYMLMSRETLLGVVQGRGNGGAQAPPSAAGTAGARAFAAMRPDAAAPAPGLQAEVRRSHTNVLQILVCLGRLLATP